MALFIISSKSTFPFTITEAPKGIKFISLMWSNAENENCSLNKIIHDKTNK